MERYDLIVVGSGAGMNVVANALGRGLRVGLVDHGPMGGTCLNNGCIPSKILVYPADVIRRLGDAEAVGVRGRITDVEFSTIMGRMHSFVDEGREELERAIAQSRNAHWYRNTGEFVGDYEIKVGDETITAPKIVIASGARSVVPPIEGIAEVGYLDNVSVLTIERPPRSLVIVGGGYIACEYGHFFSAIGAKVTILGRNPRLLKEEEPEISEIVKRRLSQHVEIHTSHEVFRAERRDGMKVVRARNLDTGEVREFVAEEILLAAGRRSNADLLKPEKTGVETDAQGWIKVNEYLETSKPNIWALGDALGKYMFRHTANYESEIVSTNALGDHKHKTDYHAVPHAVFGYPQVGSVGLTQAAAQAAGYKLLVGKSRYTDVTKGYAMAEEDTLVKVVVDQQTGRVLGCHIVGPEAAVLVQQIVYIMNAGSQDYTPLVVSEVIHPALSEVIIQAFANLVPPEHAHEHGAHDHAHS